MTMPRKLLNFEAIIIKLGTVTASDMRMQHVLIILSLTFIQGHTDRYQENNKCLIISKTVQEIVVLFGGLWKHENKKHALVIR